MLEVNLRFFITGIDYFQARAQNSGSKILRFIPSCACETEKRFKIGEKQSSICQDPGILLCAKSQQAQPFLPTMLTCSPSHL